MTARPSTPVTMADVARHAGVSTATVSRTINGVRDVDPELQARVLRSAAELGYRINLVGRALRQRRTATVGLIVPDLENPFFSSLAHHLSRAFTPATDLLVFSADSSLEAELRGVQSFVGRQVDALVLIPVHEADSAPSVELASSAVPTIQLDRRVDDTEAHFVGVNNRTGMDLIHGHIQAAVDLDRQPVVFVGAARTSSSAHERLDGFRGAFGESAPVLLGRFDSTWGLEAAGQLLADGWTSGTIVAGADVIAIGVLSRLQSAGFSVPADFRVIGFDGVGVAGLAHPTLTTIRQPVEAMSEAICQLVDSAVAGTPAQPAVQRVEPDLVLGESSPA